MTISPKGAPPGLDPASRAWVQQFRSEGPVRDAAVGRLHSILLTEARHEVRRRMRYLPHPSGPDLDDLAVQAADDALVAVLAKLEQFRGEALFTTWARRFVALEVPGEIRRRLGHTRETPISPDQWPTDPRSPDALERYIEARETVRRVGAVMDRDLSRHQREVLVALTIQDMAANDLATRLHSSSGALYKTLHDARHKLRSSLQDV